MLDMDGSGTLDWAQVTSFVAATSANSAIGASAYDPDEVKASMQTLDEDSNGTISRDEWHNYVKSVYRMRAERLALHKIVTAQLEMAHAFQAERAHHHVRAARRVLNSVSAVTSPGMLQSQATPESDFDTVGEYDNPLHVARF